MGFTSLNNPCSVGEAALSLLVIKTRGEYLFDPVGIVTTQSYVFSINREQMEGGFALRSMPTEVSSDVLQHQFCLP